MLNYGCVCVCARYVLRWNSFMHVGIVFEPKQAFIWHNVELYHFKYNRSDAYDCVYLNRTANVILYVCIFYSFSLFLFAYLLFVRQFTVCCARVCVCYFSRLIVFCFEFAISMSVSVCAVPGSLLLFVTPYKRSRLLDMLSFFSHSFIGTRTNLRAGKQQNILWIYLSEQIFRDQNDIQRTDSVYKHIYIDVHSKNTFIHLLVIEFVFKLNWVDKMNCLPHSTLVMVVVLLFPLLLLLFRLYFLLQLYLTSKIGTLCFCKRTHTQMYNQANNTTGVLCD